MDTLCVQDTFAKPEKADISASISSSISSLSQILLHATKCTPLSFNSCQMRLQRSDRHDKHSRKTHQHPLFVKYGV